MKHPCLQRTALALVLLGYASSASGRTEWATPAPRFTGMLEIPYVRSAHPPLRTPTPAPALIAPAVDQPMLPEEPRGNALDAFFAGLSRAEAQLPDGRVAIVQLGDSHTSADFFTGHLRERLQEHFGDAGRGLLLPGKPYRYYSQRDADYGTQGPWKLHIVRKKTDDEPFGITGVRMQARSPDASVWVGSCAACKVGRQVSRFEIFYRPLRAGGALAYRVDEEPWQQLSTRPARGGASVSGYHVVPVAEGAHRLTLRPAGDGPIELFGIVAERAHPGVVVDSLGVIGARAQTLFGQDWSIVGEQLLRRDPRLVILAYGTNEADNHDTDVGRMEAHFVELIHRIKMATPGASILVLGPPDMGVRARTDCEAPSRTKRRAGRPSNRNATPPDPHRIAPGCEWRTPQVLVDIIAAQRRAARRTGAAFFDTFRAMGGAERMDAMWRQDPRLAYADHVHLTKKGYALAADLLLTQLRFAYERWQHEVPRPIGSAPAVTTDAP